MGRYGKPFIVKTRFEEGISKLKFDIDLSHLKNSKFVPGSPRYLAATEEDSRIFTDLCKK